MVFHQGRPSPYSLLWTHQYVLDPLHQTKLVWNTVCQSKYPLDRPDLLSRCSFFCHFLRRLIKCLMHACKEFEILPPKKNLLHEQPTQFFNFKVWCRLHLQHPMPRLLVRSVHHAYLTIKCGLTDKYFSVQNTKSALSLQIISLRLLIVKALAPLTMLMLVSIATDIPTPANISRSLLNHQRP